MDVLGYYGYVRGGHHLTLNDGLYVLIAGVVCLLFSLNPAYGKFLKNPLGGIGLILIGAGMLIIIYMRYYSPYAS